MDNQRGSSSQQPSSSRRRSRSPPPPPAAINASPLPALPPPPPFPPMPVELPGGKLQCPLCHSEFMTASYYDCHMHPHSPTPGRAEEALEEIERTHGGVPPPHLANLLRPHLEHKQAPPPPPPPPPAPAKEAGLSGSGSGVPDLNEPVAEGDEEKE